MGSNYSKIEPTLWCDYTTYGKYLESYSILRGVGDSKKSAFEELKKLCRSNGVEQPIYDATVDQWYCGRVYITTMHLCCFWNNEKIYNNTVLFSKINDTFTAYVLYYPI